jgi:hypothetical protein
MSAKNRVHTLGILSVFVLLSTLSLTTRADITTGSFRFWTNGRLNDTHTYTGPCPVALRFGFWIGSPWPTTATYTFSRSDGAINNQVQTAAIPGNGRSATVFDEWHLGANIPQFENFQGWIQVNATESNSSSYRMPFTLHCSVGDSGQSGLQPQPANQSFAGVWDLVGSSMNGAPQSFKPSRLRITQNGLIVGIGNRQYTMNNPNFLILQTFYAWDGQAGREVSSANEADLVDTFKWYLLDDGRLRQEVIFNYRNAYGNHPPGSDHRDMFYRRVGY